MIKLTVAHAVLCAALGARLLSAADPTAAPDPAKEPGWTGKPALSSATAICRAG